MSANIIYNIITIIELIVVEQLMIYFISKGKCRLWLLILLNVLITAGLLAFMILFAVKDADYGDGSGRFLVLGIFYFVPVLACYADNIRKKLIIAFFSFSYGLACFGIAVRVAYLLPANLFDLIGMILPAVLFLATFYPVYVFATKKVLPYLNKSNKELEYLMIRFVVASFLLVILYNTAMTRDGMVLKFITYILLGYFIILSYKLIFFYLRENDNASELATVVAVDRLCCLGNRVAFKECADALISSGTDFSIIYIDLDKFKSINDNYGHDIGDIYLKEFAAALKTLSCDSTQFFRMSGDEFTCLTECDNMLSRLSSLKIKLSVDVEFLGFSCGEASCPTDGADLSQLIECADKRMYIQKRAKF